MCPCLYIVQVFDNTPASRDGTLEAGDELVGVNGANVKVRREREILWGYRERLSGQDKG